MSPLRPLALLLACLAGAPALAAPQPPAPTPAPAATTPPADGAAVDLWQLFQEAQAADPRILAAQAKSRSAAWTEREAFGQMLPQVGLSGTYNRTFSDTESFGSFDGSQDYYNGERYALGLRQVLYDPAAWQSYRRFSALAGQQEAEARNTLEQASVDLVERYFAALAAEDVLALVRAELHATQRNQERVQSLFQRQLAMITDVLEISARVDSLKADEIEAANQVTVSREALAELVGRPVGERLRRLGPRPAFTLPPHDSEHWVQTALTSNPALLAQKQAVDAAQASVREARAGHLPTVSLNLSGQRSDIGYENSRNPRTDTYVASVGVQVPIYSGGSTSARTSSMYEQLMAAEHTYEAARRQLVRETREAYYGAETSLGRIVAGRTAQTSAEKARQAAERAFELGVMNAVDVLDSVKEEYRARRDLLKAQYDFITNLLVLHRWSGTLVDEDIRRANEWLVAEGPR